MSDQGYLGRALERARIRFHHLVGFGQVTAPVDDTGPVQTAQVRVSPVQTRDAVPNLMQYGFTSVPPIGADVVTLSHSGEPSSTVIIAVGHQTYRLRGLASGDAALYDDRGAKVILSAAGITIDAAGQPVTVVGDLRVTGAVTAGYGTGDQVSLQTHRHGGVQVGGSSTGAPTAGT